MKCPALPALALLSLSAGLAAAQTPPEAIVAPGIYAAMQAPVDVTALPPAALEQGAKLCKNTPSLVYPDGLMRALKPSDMEAAVAGGPFFVRAGGMRCPQMGAPRSPAARSRARRTAPARCTASPSPRSRRGPIGSASPGAALPSCSCPATRSFSISRGRAGAMCSMTCSNAMMAAPPSRARPREPPQTPTP